MKGRRIYLDHLGSRETAALVVDGRLDDLLIDDDAPRIGTVYRGICDRALKGQGGMIVRIPGGTAWLRAARGLSVGQVLLLQVTGVAEAGKAVPCTDRLLFKSRYAIVTPASPGINVSRRIADDDERDRLLVIAHDALPDRDGPPFGLILRSQAQGAVADEVAEDVVAMCDLAEAVLSGDGKSPETLLEGYGPHAVAWREWDADDVITEPGCFARDGVLDLIGHLGGAKVPLDDDAGATMYVEATRALVAVDVNTGADTSPAASLKTNLAAARALPRALRLRGLGGQIVVDFAPMPKGQRKQLEQSLRGSFRNDSVETSLVGWSPMGLFELQRKRERAPTAGLIGDTV